jgi:ectoine hydroxylase-related dioxygenase (phytanoyl-CoA dioxygenase family)
MRQRGRVVVIASADSHANAKPSAIANPNATATDARALEALFTEYRRDGYCVVRGVLPRAAVEEVLVETDRLFALQLQRLGRRPRAYQNEDTVRTNLEALLGADVKAYLAAARLAAKLASLQRLTASKPVVDLVESFGIATPTIATTPVLHIMGDTLRIPGGYFGVAPHQDWPSIQGGLDTITMWVPLMDVGPKQFPVEVIPGSHLRGLWEGEITHNALEIRKGFVESDFIPVAADRGDVLLFTGFTVHRTSLRGCSGLRVASSTRYENSGEPTFIDRNYPCAYKRSVARELMVKGFPTAEQVAAIYR